MKRVTRFSVLGFMALLFMIVCTPSTTEAATVEICSPVLHLPPGSIVTLEGEGLFVVYPDNTEMSFNCHCSAGSGDCTEASNGTELYCKKLTGCTDCHAHLETLAY
jgi:hypothetical protein